MALSAITSHKLQLRYMTPLMSYVGVAYIRVIEAYDLYNEVYTFLHSFVCSFYSGILGTLWLLGFVGAQDTYSL